MTLTSDPRERHVAAPPPGDRRTRSPIWKILTTTDHKTIGLMYLITSLAFFMFGGVLALLMRAELARPGRGCSSSPTSSTTSCSPCTARSCC